MAMAVWRGAHSLILASQSRARQTLRNIGRMLAAFFRVHLPPADLTIDNPEAIKVPFGVAAAVAVLLDEQLVETRNLQAPAIIKEHIAPLIKGGGGGQKKLATAGGQDASNLPLVIERVKKLL